MATPEKNKISPQAKETLPNGNVIDVNKLLQKQEDPSVSISNQFEDKIRKAVKVINDINVYTFDFKQAEETKKFFKDFKLTEYGAKTGPEPPKFIYDVIKTNIIDQLYNFFNNILKEDFKQLGLSPNQLFKQLIVGLKVKTYDPKVKAIIDEKAKNFNTNPVLASLFINYVYDNPSVLIPKTRTPKLLFITGDSNQFYDTSPIVINQEEIIKYLNIKNAPFEQIGFKIENYFLYKIIDSKKSTEKLSEKTAEEYLKTVKEIYQSFLFDIDQVFKQSGYTPTADSKQNVKNSIQSIINKINEIDSYIAINENKIIFPPQEQIKDKKDLYNFIVKYGLDQKNLIESLKDISLNAIKLMEQIGPLLPKSPNQTSSGYSETLKEFEKFLIDPLFQTIDKRYKDFVKYYTKLEEEIGKKVLPYLKILSTSFVKFPIYKYTEELVNPKFYGPTPDLDIDLLYDKKVDIYKNKDPKLLFTFQKPQLLSHEKILIPIFNKEGKGNYKPSKEQQFINALQPTKIFVYRADYEIKNLTPDLLSDGNLLKELDVKDDSLSFYDILEPNKNYYYFYVSKFTKPTDETVYLIDNNYVIISGEDLYWFCSPIIKVKLVKDSNFYFLETDTFTENDFIETKYEENFKNKMSITPKSKSFGYGGSSFASGQESYLKIRVTSSKTNKKLDLNLKYTINKEKKNMKNYEKEKLKPEMVEDLNDEIVKNIIKSKFKNQNVTELINNIVKTEESGINIEASDLSFSFNSVLNTALAEAVGINPTSNKPIIDNKIIEIGKLIPKK